MRCIITDKLLFKFDSYYDGYYLTEYYTIPYDVLEDVLVYKIRSYRGKILKTTIFYKDIDVTNIVKLNKIKSIEELEKILNKGEYKKCC